MPQIRVKNGPQKGKIIPIEGSATILIGRDPGTHLQVIDKGVSREHAEIFRVGEMVFIRDLGSRNGTYVNHERMEEELLREGDTIRVGTTQLVFESAKTTQEQGSKVLFEEGEDFRTSLELKLDDLYVSEIASSGREHEHFRAVCQATRLLYAEQREKELFERLMDLIQEYVPADHLYLFLKDAQTGAIIPRATRAKGSVDSIPVSRTILRSVISDSRAILTADAMQDERFKTGDSIVLNQIRSVLCVPIQSGLHSMGAIYAVNARLAETFDDSDLQLLMAIGAQLAFRIEGMLNAQAQYERFCGLLGRLLAVMEKCGPGMPCHAERVSRYATAIAEEMNLTPMDVYQVRLSALLHEVGKLTHSSGPSPAARERERGVADASRVEDVLEGVPGMDGVLENIHGHLERVDGEGPSHGRKGDRIPLGARILTVADGFDRALETSRGGQGEDESGLSAAVRKAFTQLTEEAGKAYDGEALRALMVAYRRGKLFDKAERAARIVEAPMPEPDADADPSSATMRMHPGQSKAIEERARREKAEPRDSTRRDSTRRAAKSVAEMDEEVDDGKDP